MSGMRSLALAAFFLCSCAASDPFAGTYNATMTGTENQTAPSMEMRTLSGMGSVSVTQDKERVGYVVLFGENYLCRLKATKSTATPTELEIADGQSCSFSGFTATTTGGKVTMDKDTMTTVTLTVSYSYAYTLIFNYAGTGTRTYTGGRL